MGALATIAALCFGLVGVGLAALLLVPIRFAAEGVLADDRVDALADVSWGLGVAGVQATPTGGFVLKLFGRTVYHLRTRASPKRAVTTSRTPARARRWPEGRLVWRVLRRVVGSLRLRGRVRGRLGTGDPADAATMLGVLLALRGLIRGLDTTLVRVDWMEPVVDLEGRLDGRLWPAAIVWIVASEFVRSRSSHRPGEVL